jgi:hypothetical protein
MDVPTYFEDFLRNIRPDATQRSQMSEAHNDLRDRLQRDKKLQPIIIANFIQGSYRRHTGLVGTKENQCDVDLVVVTNVPSSSPPTLALEMFRPFLEENYKGRYEPQGRSWCIHWNSIITLDLVPTSAPSEANRNFLRAIGSGFTFEDPVFDRSMRKFAGQDVLAEAYLAERKKEGWQLEPLEIPDREARVWAKTHPLAQIAWTAEKNAACDGHYINVVRAIKWWRRAMQPEPKYPKGYPLEHLVGACCPNGMGSVGEGVAMTLDAIVNNYAADVAAGRKPFLRDHGVDHDVFKRVPVDHFMGFYEKLKLAARLARDARAAETLAKSVTLWRQLFGEAFPEPPQEKSGPSNNQAGGFSPRVGPTVPAGGRFA